MVMAGANMTNTDNTIQNGEIFPSSRFFLHHLRPKFAFKKRRRPRSASAASFHRRPSPLRITRADRIHDHFVNLRRSSSPLDIVFEALALGNRTNPERAVNKAGNKRFPVAWPIA